MESHSARLEYMVYTLSPIGLDVSLTMVLGPSGRLRTRLGWPQIPSKIYITLHITVMPDMDRTRTKDVHVVLIKSILYHSIIGYHCRNCLRGQ